MTGGQDEEVPTHPLLEAGWIQGVMFDAPGAAYGMNVSQGNSTSLAPENVRHVRASERLILISHVCDIVAPEEKYVEALICKKYDPTKDILSAWEKNSPTYFVVDPNLAYVANASHRVKIAKETLLSLNHYGNSMDRLRQDRFVQWLARRYDRPVVPDHIYKRFHRLVYAELNRLHEESWEPLKTFNQVVHEIRIYLPIEESPPYSVGVVYLTRSALTAAQAEAISEIHRVVVGSAHADVNVEGLPIMVELDEVPYGILRRTQPLIIEHPSWEDEEAASPTWLSSS
jgi:hypothetical protein